MHERFEKGEHHEISGLASTTVKLIKCPTGQYYDVYTKREGQKILVWTYGPQTGKAYDRIKSDTIRCITEEVIRRQESGCSWTESLLLSILAEWMEEEQE